MTVCVGSPQEDEPRHSSAVTLMDEAQHFMSLLSREERERIMTALDEGVDWQEIPE